LFAASHLGVTPSRARSAGASADARRTGFRAG